MTMDLDNPSSSPGPDDDVPSSSIVKAESSEDEFRIDDIDIKLPARRHSVSSAGSEYNPSSADEHSAAGDGIGAQAEPEREFDKPPRSLLKRVLSSPQEEEERPFKRSRANFNHEYLDLLNDDIRDTTDQFVPGDSTELFPSQVGITYWTTAEKEVFYEALSRLGPDKAADIAARIRTKGELEVAQYLHLLERTAKARKQGRELQHTVPTEIPAAIELSQACCSALEEAADGISVRQDAYEELEEKRQWGTDHWLITRSNRREIEKAAPPELNSVKLFRTKAWLDLSERVFMNAAFSEYNWASVSEERPSIRATALEDFYSLTASVTRRIVAATIYVSESSHTARAKDLVDAGLKREVRRQDVEAAVLSLGFPTNSQKFWAGCPRRLRLEIYDDEGSGNGVDEEEPEILSYSDVEEALGGLGDDRTSSRRREADSSDDESDMASLSDTPSIDEVNVKEEAAPPSQEDEDGHEPIPGVDEEEVLREAKELLKFSALDYPTTTRATRTLKARIRIAHAQEAYANAADSRASYNEEKRLWAMLGRTPPENLVKPEQLEARPAGFSHPVDELIYTRTTGGGGWRDGLEFVASKWELDAQELLREREADA